MNQLCYPLAVQVSLPENYRNLEDSHLLFRDLHGLGFSSVELNIACPERVDAQDLEGFLSECGLTLSMFATGLTAKTEGLSLSNEDDALRLRSIQRCIEFIEFAAQFGAGIIVGFLKGKPATDVAKARALMTESLKAIAPAAEKYAVLVLVEATNRYESSVANALEDTVALLGPANPYLQILPDTFHMNIEEADMYTALKKYSGYYTSIHLSDNNRYFPGFGAIDFSHFLAFIRDNGYQGGLAIEGNVHGELIADLRVSMDMLRPFLT